MAMGSKKWNQGDLEQNPFSMRRLSTSHQMVIDGPVDKVFKRASLTAQPGWLSATTVCLAYGEATQEDDDATWSEAETGMTLFQRPKLQTYWSTTLLDPSGHRFQAVLLNPDLAIGRLDVAMHTQGSNTVVSFAISYTGVSKAGCNLLEDGAQGRMIALLKRFGTTLQRNISAGPRPQIEAVSHQVKSRVIEHEVEIDGDVDACFTLACPNLVRQSGPVAQPLPFRRQTQRVASRPTLIGQPTDTTRQAQG